VPGPIRFARVAAGRLEAGAQELLPGEIDGVVTRYLVVEEGRPRSVEERPGAARVMLFVRGAGVVEIHGGQKRPVAAQALLAVAPAVHLAVSARRGGVELLEILMELTPGEAQESARRSAATVHYLPYAEAAFYREDIKSPKTLNRTLLPVGVVPRLTIGSVETAGPDRVEAHRHPMLEQLFYGLPGNCCRLRADEAEVAFGEDTLLHIPLGSLHGVSVEKGAVLHYVWMDFFKSRQDMSYIEEHHQSMGEPEEHS
jgi:mannose-6-phosphate isomerase-like protein (cupin superfamily)